MEALSLILLAVSAQLPTVEDFGRGLRWEQAPLPVSSGVASGSVSDVVSPGDVDGDGLPDLVTISSIPDGYYGFSSVELVAISAADDAVLWATTYQHPTGPLATIGDLDGDGLEEIAIGARRWPAVSTAQTGEVFVYSGGSGAALHNIAGTNHGEEFGSAVAGIDDLDGDGVPDLLIGATEFEQSHYTWNPGVGFIAAYSGATGQEIYRVNSPVLGTNFYTAGFGVSLAVLSDVDGDGLQDFVAGAPVAARRPLLTLHSGADGRIIGRWTGPQQSYGFGHTLAPLGDLDGDGLTEFATIVRQGAGSTGVLQIYSPVLQDCIREIPGFLELVPPRATPDVDGDGRRDLLAWHQQSPSDHGRMRLLGSRTLQPIADFIGPVGASAPRQVGGLWVDPRDGSFEVLAPFVIPGTDPRTGRYFRSRGYREVITAPSRVSVAALPGSVAIEIDLHANRAGLSYLLLLSTNPQGPQQFLGVEVPLGPSALLTQSLLGTVPGLAGGHGTLDAYGDATASLLIAAPTSPGLVGRAVHISVLAHVGVLGAHASSPAVLHFIP